MNEGSGTTVYDRSGYDNHGVIFGATWQKIWRDWILSFDGTDDYVGIGKPLLNNLKEFTLAGWIFPRASGSRIGFFGQNDAIEFGFINSTTIQCWTSGGGSVNWSFTPDTFPMNEWHFVAVVGNGASSPYLALYIDGARVATGGKATENFGSSPYPFNIGGGGVFDASGNWLNGLIGEVLVFRKALSAEQISFLYNLFRGELRKPP